MPVPGCPGLSGTSSSISAPRSDRLSARWAGAVQAGLFFLLFWLLLWAGVDVKLIYHGGGELSGFPVFYWSRKFARELALGPGGGARWLAALEMQTLYHSWLGALVLTANAWLIWLPVKTFARQMGMKWVGAAGYASSLLLLGMYCRYAHFATAIVCLTLALPLALGLAWWPWDNVLSRASFLLPAMLLLYLVAAQGLIVFSVAAALLALRAPRGWLQALMALALGCVVAWLGGTLLFGLAPGESFRVLLPHAWSRNLIHHRGFAMFAALWSLTPVVGLLALAAQSSWCRALSAWIQTKSHNAPTGARRGMPGSRRPRRGKTANPTAGLGRWVLETALLGLTVVGVFFLLHDRRLKTVLDVDYYCSHQMWSRALAAAQTQMQDPFVACSAAQAAYHLGRLSRTLPQVAAPDDLLLLGRGPYAHWKQAQLYLDLGFVNWALHHLTEAMEFWGERPLLLKKLAIANMALGNIATARIYLEALAQVPFQGGWARRHLHFLEADPTLDHDKEVAHLRSLTASPLRTSTPSSFTGKSTLPIIPGTKWSSTRETSGRFKRGRCSKTAASITTAVTAIPCATINRTRQSS